MKKLLTVSGLLAIALHLDAQNIGVGTTNPLAKFSVGTASQFQVDTVGNIKRINNIPYSFPVLQGATGQVLGNNGAGQLEWVNQLGGWSLNGNSGNPASYFLGTTDTMPLYFRVNNVRAGAIDQVRANVFLGSNSGGAATTGDGNAAVGFNSLNALTTGTSTAHSALIAFAITPLVHLMWELDRMPYLPILPVHLLQPLEAVHYTATPAALQIQV